MNDIIQIQCPKDGAILSIKNQPGLERKNVTCPVCKQMRPFTHYKRYIAQTSGYTEYPGKRDGMTQYGGYMDGTRIDIGKPLALGKLVVVSTGKEYQLKPGRNVIGREAVASSTDIQIDTGDSRRMSREHVVIEVAKIAGKGYVHQARLFKERCNATFVNKTQLEYGDCIVLHHGDVLRMPDVDVKFEIPNGDDTEF